MPVGRAVMALLLLRLCIAVGVGCSPAGQPWRAERKQEAPASTQTTQVSNYVMGCKDLTQQIMPCACGCSCLRNCCGAQRTRAGMSLASMLHVWHAHACTRCMGSPLTLLCMGQHQTQHASLLSREAQPGCTRCMRRRTAEATRGSCECLQIDRLQEKHPCVAVLTHGNDRAGHSSRHCPTLPTLPHIPHQWQAPKHAQTSTHHPHPPHRQLPIMTRSFAAGPRGQASLCS